MPKLKRARRDGRGRTASSRSDRTGRRRRTPTARGAARPRRSAPCRRRRPLGDRALVPARVAPDAVLRNPLDQLRRRLGRSDLEDLREGGHWIILRSDVVSKPKVVSGFSRTMGGLETPLANKKPVHRLQQGTGDCLADHEVQRLLGHDDFVRGDARDLRLVGLLRSLQPIG